MIRHQEMPTADKKMNNVNPLASLRDANVSAHYEIHFINWCSMLNNNGTISLQHEVNKMDKYPHPKRVSPLYTAKKVLLFFQLLLCA